MSEYDWENSLGLWLTRTTQAYHRALSLQLASEGLTWRQIQVIGWLKLETELSPKDLSQRMVVEPPALAGILDRMERDGLITRHACVDDRRKKLVRLAPTAEPLWDVIAAAARELRSQAISGLTADEVETLKRLLHTIHQNIEGSGFYGDPAATSVNEATR